MEKLTNKRAHTFDYTSRYSGVPYYFDTKKNRDIPGIGYQINFNTPYVLHTVKAADTLDTLALDYYDNPSYWWAIAYFNKIRDPFVPLALNYSTLKIPTISSIIFED
jgi:nucleoid-associated protein YgaU